MKKLTLTFCIIASLLITANAQVTVGGVSVPDKMQVGNSNLVLNGAGTRVKLFMDMYVGGLYVTTKSNNGDAIAKANEPTAVTIHVVSSLVTSERMSDAIKEGFQKSTGGKTAPLQSRIDKFIKLFSNEPITKGNEFLLKYVPGEGVHVYKGAKLLDTIDGQDFKVALWGIWLGNEPVDKGLKVAMLGGSK